MAFQPDSRLTRTTSGLNNPELHELHDPYESVAAQWGYGDEPEAARAPRKAKTAKPRKSQAEMQTELAAGGDSLFDRFEITYKPARYEAIWLPDSLRPFAENAVLRDVLSLVKGGKEANVYLCEAEPATGYGLMAAKVYRPRQFRNLRNDKMYREGRETISSLGTAIKQRDNREMRAIGKKTSFGQELTHISWLMHEYITLQRLYEVGAATPRPIASGVNALLMEFVGDRRLPAPPLYAVTLGSAEAHALYAEVMRNIELMLSLGMIHGDLSAYNILYWQGKVTIIDFPQVTSAVANSNAWKILLRDVERVGEYFATQGVESDPEHNARALWDRYVRLPIVNGRPPGSE